ncbi:hypothetical protein [Actinoallomurus sp. CA-150999]|uniref:hypothetical protein n=1 Tax=Actinoallomurus sp. CA-150999 TaxID=3239887 RepID=UPI003D8D1D4B
MFEADAGASRRLVWISRLATTVFVVVMLSLFALFGAFAFMAIVLVVPASITALGTHLLRRGRLAGAAVTLTATLPCAALGVAVPSGQVFTLSAAGIGGTLLVPCWALVELTAKEMIFRPHRWRDGRAGVVISFLACLYVAGTVTFVLAVAVGKDFARGWTAPGAAAFAGVFALLTAVACAYARRRWVGAMFLALTLVHPGVWLGVVTVARTAREVPAISSTSPLNAPSPEKSHTPSPRKSHTPSPQKSHCACYSGGPCPCPGG